MNCRWRQAPGTRQTHTIKPRRGDREESRRPGFNLATPPRLVGAWPTAYAVQGRRLGMFLAGFLCPESQA